MSYGIRYRRLFPLCVVLCLGLQFSHAAPIEVQVEISEVDHTRAKQLGVEWVEKVGLSETRPHGIVSVGPVERLTSLQADVHFLVENGAAELLAQPNLVTDSGTEAQFHAGGEIPYITSTSLGSTHVQFKPFGVALKMTPRLLKSEEIQMNIHASVSAPDFTNGVRLSGNTVPALFERDVKSRITVEPGMTITLAGLVQTRKETLQRGIPFLRRIPILGYLFRWKSERFRQTSVIIFVTPKIIAT